MTLMESKKKHTPTYTAEFRERGVRLYREHRSDYTSDNAAYRALARSLAVPMTPCAPGACMRRVTPASVLV
jgi:hypothetical protein